MYRLKPLLCWLPLMTILLLYAADLHAQENSAQSKAPSTLAYQIVIMVTTIITLGYQVLMRIMDNRRDERRRQWDLEDRERARVELAQRVVHSAQVVREEQKTIANEIKERIDQNTDISVRAFKEANDINAKIARLTKQFYESGTTPEGVKEASEVLHRVDANTQEAVKILRDGDE